MDHFAPIATEMDLAFDVTTAEELAECAAAVTAAGGEVRNTRFDRGGFVTFFTTDRCAFVRAFRETDAGRKSTMVNCHTPECDRLRYSPTGCVCGFTAAHQARLATVVARASAYKPTYVATRSEESRRPLRDLSELLATLKAQCATLDPKFVECN